MDTGRIVSPLHVHSIYVVRSVALEEGIAWVHSLISLFSRYSIMSL